MIILPQLWFQNINLPLSAEGDAVSPLAAGGEVIGVPLGALVLQVVLALGFFVVAALAWRGRPPAIRFVMVGTILGLFVFQLGAALLQLLAQPDFMRDGIDSAESLRRLLTGGQVLTALLVTLYVVWYMNRGPARAFYRGYYLQDPHETTSTSAQH